MLCTKYMPWGSLPVLEVGAGRREGGKDHKFDPKLLLTKGRRETAGTSARQCQFSN